MADRFWIGEHRMEIFKLWLAARITILSYRADDLYWVNMVKKVLNSLGDCYLTSESEIQYGLFVNDLIDSIN